MSLTFKLLSLGIRTAAKPIGNYIKRQAKEHEGFRKFAVNQAQRVHRIDMRMRLGILHDPEAQQRMHEREQRAAEEKKRKAEVPTVRSELEQKKYDEQKEKETAETKETKSVKAKIRPLSEARAIELGANFFSEAFIFGVAVSLLLFENWRRSAKESDRRDDVADSLEELRAAVLELRSKIDPNFETLNELRESQAQAKQKKSTTSWWNPGGWIGNQTPAEEPKADKDVDIRQLQKEAEERSHRITKQREEAKMAKDAAKEQDKKSIIQKAFEKKSTDKHSPGQEDSHLDATHEDAVEASSSIR